jgi:Stage II sporulation protein E (SpoIIE)
MDDINAFLFRALSRIPSSKTLMASVTGRPSESEINREPPLSDGFGLALAISCLVLAVLFFVSRLAEYGQWPPAIYQTSEVYNLTSQKVVWDIHYGPSRGCLQDECYRDESTPKSYFRRQAVLPLREFPIPDWQHGDPIFYRATIKIPSELINRTDLNPLSLHTVLMFAKSWDFYLNNTLVFQGTQETMLVPIPQSFIRHDGTVAISIRANVGDLPYQGIANKGDLVIGPRSKLAPISYLARDNETSLQLLYLLPKLAFCVVFSIIFMFVRRNQEIAWFLGFGLSSSLELFLKSGFSSGLGIGSETTLLLALLTRNYSLLFLARFIYAFFRLNIKSLEKFLRLSTLVLTIFNILCLFVFSYQQATRILDIIAIVLKPCVYLFSVLLAALMAASLSGNERSRVRARIALILMMLFIFGNGLAFIDLTNLITNTLNIQWGKVAIVNFGWIFDLILFVFMASITGLEMATQHAHGRNLQNKLENIDSRLELAASVQNSLLPSPMAGSEGNIEWTCRYIPAERMAGDWLYIGTSRSRPPRFFLGDVTGKGPAAALAVAAIISLLKSMDDRPSDVEDTISTLNKHLFQIFHGHSSTGVCLAEIGQDGVARIVVQGMAGWIHVSQTNVKIANSRGSPLGGNSAIEVTCLEVPMEVGDSLLCFSDGCLEGSREMRKFIQELNKLERKDMNFEKVFDMVNEIGKGSVLLDDKAMIMLKRTL